MHCKILTFSTVQFFRQACMDKKELLQYNPLHTVKYSALLGGKTLELPYFSAKLEDTWVLDNNAQCTGTANNVHTEEDSAVIELIHRDPEGRTQLQEAPTIKHSISIGIFPPF